MEIYSLMPIGFRKFSNFEENISRDEQKLMDNKFYRANVFYYRNTIILPKILLRLL